MPGGRVCAMAADPSPPLSLVPPGWRQGLGESAGVSALQQQQAPAWPECGRSGGRQAGRGHSAGVPTEEEEGCVQGRRRLGAGSLPPPPCQVLCGAAVCSVGLTWPGRRHPSVLSPWVPGGDVEGWRPAPPPDPLSLAWVLRHQSIPTTARPARG